ncbi:hypothetical protein EDD85DRAFT_1025909, partial [Armillaria nabsnona]
MEIPIILYKVMCRVQNQWRNISSRTSMFPAIASSVFWVPQGRRPLMVLLVLLAPISSKHLTASLTTLTSYLGTASPSTLLET